MRGLKRLRRPGVYELRVYAGRDPVTHKERTATRTFAGGAKAADKALRAFVAEVEGSGGPATSATVAMLLQDWLAHAERLGRSPTTLREYRRLIDKTIGPAIGHVQLRRLTAHDLDTLYGQCSDRGLAPGSVRQVHAIIRAALRQGKKWGQVPANVAEDATPPSARPRAVPAPTAAAVQAMVVAADAEDPDLAVLIALAATTGARRGELCGLVWGDVDWERGQLTIARAVAVVDGRRIVKDTKTHAARVVALGDLAVAVLRKHRERMDDRARYSGVELEPSSPLISYDLVTPVSPDTVSHYVRAVATRAGVDTHLHALRHFAATQMIGAGTDVRTVAGRLGHADASTTLRVYSHALPERDREAAGVLDRVLRPT